MLFEFATAPRIRFGAGTRRELGALAGTLGRRPLVVTGAHPERHDELLALLGPDVPRVRIAGEPTVHAARQGAELARVAGADCVIALGGGSVLDAGKAIAALAVHPGDPFRYLEVIGEGKPLERDPLPCLAAPTTAGTGSEATRNAVLASPDHGVKVSLRHAAMLPRIALVDPELTLDLPPAITASTGMDALTQLIEPYVSTKANPLTDALCIEGIRRAAGSLERAWRDGRDLEARTDMALASLMGGMALANAGLGAVHGLAAPLGGLHPVPHGVACAVLLPHVLEANLRALPEGDARRDRFVDIARLLTGRPDATAEEGPAWVRATVAALRIPGLRAHGLAEGDLAQVAERSLSASSMKANPVALSAAVLEEILAAAL